MIINLNDEYARALLKGVETLKNNGVIIFPTDTVYGIGCDARNEKLIEKIYSIKNRKGNKPFAVIMSGFDMINEWCELGKNDEKMIIEHLPGPYTFILNLKKGKTLSGQSWKVGVRVPQHAFICKLAEKFGAPISATSANKSGKENAISFEEIEQSLIEASDLSIDGGKTLFKQPSTVIDLVEKKILREGAGIISKAKLFIN